MFNESSYIDLPGPVKLIKAIINVQNSDNAFFYWAIVAALYRSNDHSDYVKVQIFPDDAE